MKIKDIIFGEIKIDEPIIIELIKTPTLERLKGIDQAGYFKPYFPGSKHTRFEHSVGVYFLLKKFNAPLEEQIAGLIHDISHSAFSHCIDYITSDGSGRSQCHQDRIFKDYLLKTNIPDILNKYNFNVDYIINEKNFLLLETELPELCADRIDYSLRGLVTFNEITKKEADEIINNFIITENKWVFKNFKIAEKYARLFLLINQKYYAGIISAVMFKGVKDYLKYGLEKKYIKYEDLYKIDDYVINKINKHLESDEYLNKLWQRMNNKMDYKNDKADFEEVCYCKSRIVDPLVMHNNEIRRVSDIKPGWKEVVKAELLPKKYYIKFFK